MPVAGTGLSIRLRVDIKPELRRDLERAPEIMAEEMQRGLDEALIAVVGSIQKQITTIHLIDTGRLRNSIHGETIYVDAHGFKGEVKTGPAQEIPYARIHEEGGVIVPVNARVLAWTDRGVPRPEPGDKAGWQALRAMGMAHYAKRVTIRAKHYMRDGLANSVPQITKIIRKTVRRAWARIVYEKGGADVAD